MTEQVAINYKEAGARLSYLEAWASKLERAVPFLEAATAEDAKEKAKALRDQIAFCRQLMGINYTPVDTRPTMEIREEHNGH